MTNNANRVSTTQYGYDAGGRVVCTVSPGEVRHRAPLPGHRHPAGRGILGHLRRVRPGRLAHRRPRPHHHYAYSGRATTITDAENHATRQVLDQDGREVTSTTGYGSATAATTTTSYDRAPGVGSCPATTGVAVVHHRHRPPGPGDGPRVRRRRPRVRTSIPGPHVTTTSYDLAGRAHVVTNPDASTVTYGYDDAGRLLTKDYSSDNPADVTYTYDTDGRRASMTEATSPAHRTDYTYGDLGLLASVTEKSGTTTTSTVGYDRDSTGHVTAIHYPDSRVVTQTYDTAGEVTAILDGVGGRTTTFGYDRDGNLTDTTFAGSAGSITSSYDATGAMTGTTATDGAGTDLLSLSYTRAGTGQVASETGTGAATGGGSYGYTANNRLAGAGTTAFGYDLSGNPTGLGATTQTFTASGALGTSDAAGTMQTFGYNANGDRTTAAGDITSTYTYDQASQLTSSQTSLTPTEAGEFHPLAPARILDTRDGTGGVTGPVASHATVNSRPPAKVEYPPPGSPRSFSTSPTPTPPATAT